MVEGKCPLCGKSIPVDPQTDAGICPYCSNAYVTAKALQGQSSTPSPNSIAALSDRCTKLCQAEMFNQAAEAAETATRLFPDDYRSWVLRIFVFSSTPDFKTPYPQDWVDNAAKLYRLSDKKNPRFEKWYADYQRWLQQAQRAVDLCNKLDASHALRLIGCSHLEYGYASRETIPCGNALDGYQSKEYVAKTRYGRWIDSTRFRLAPYCGIVLDVTYGEHDGRFHSFQECFQRKAYIVALEGNLVDALPDLERAAGR